MRHELECTTVPVALDDRPRADEVTGEESLERLQIETLGELRRLDEVAKRIITTFRAPRSGGSAKELGRWRISGFPPHLPHRSGSRSPISSVCVSGADNRVHPVTEPRSASEGLDRWLRPRAGPDSSQARKRPECGLS